MCYSQLQIVLTAVAVIGSSSSQSLSKDDEFRQWVLNFNPQAAHFYNFIEETRWSYQTNITDHNKQVQLEASNLLAEFTKSSATDMKSRFKKSDLSFAPFQRLHVMLSNLGDQALPADKYAELTKLQTELETIYYKAKVCINPRISDPAKCPDDELKALDPDLTEIMFKNRDPEVLHHVWKSWLDATGKKMREVYIRTVQLKNEAAKLNGFSDAGRAWRESLIEPTKNYTDERALKDIKRLWEEVKPLYQELHAYIRGKLMRLYGGDLISATGPIPAHLLGNMWAQSWLGLLNVTQLFPDKPLLDVSEEMKRQGYTVKKVFQVADDFFGNLGLIRLSKEFWQNSMLERPVGREVNCHASAWDFFKGNDFRIKMCTVIDMKDLFTVHHELGHIQYFMQYKNQWIPFRQGANDGFHEAVGDTISLSVSTPEHLKKIGLLSEDQNIDDPETDLNFLFTSALEKVVFLPFGLLLDLYRYEIFDGTIKLNELNAKWWEKRAEYQGVCSPIPRDEIGLDAGSKFHIAADVPYMRYFISFILQFQFHDALCKAAGHDGPLHRCDIDGSKAAGDLMAAVLSKGGSKPWQDALKIMTGQEEMSAKPLLKFFEPLHQYLRSQNKRLGNRVGWTKGWQCGKK